MLKPKKKLARKEIKEDTLVKTYAQATSFYYENKKYVNYALTGLAALGALLYVFMKNRSANNEKAALELTKAYSIYDGGATDPQQYNVAINGQPERGVMGLKGIVQNYGSSESGELARFYLASAYFNTGRYDEALKAFEKFSPATDLLKGAAYAGMGGCQEVKHEFAMAGSLYEKAAATIGTTAAAEYLNSAARCYAMAGEKGKAVVILKRIKKEFPTSSAAREADRFISQFSA